MVAVAAVNPRTTDLMTKYTDPYVGGLLRQAVDKVVPALVATYTAGFIFGQFVHSLNNKLAQAVK